MPTYEIVHAVETTIKHRVTADTPEQANALAVELTLQRARDLAAQHADLGFGPLDDRHQEPKEVPAA